MVDQALQCLMLSKHTPTQSLLAQKAAKDGEQQMSVKGTRQRTKRQKDNMGSMRAAAALLNFLYAKERGEERGG